MSTYETPHDRPAGEGNETETAQVGEEGRTEEVKTCETCKHRGRQKNRNPCYSCHLVSDGNSNWEQVPVKKRTNADHIRAMTDEELADWVLSHDCKTNLYGYLSREETLDWLKQEADNG